MERVIIGLTGPTAGGKGEIAKHLESQGFVYFSLSDVIRDQATKYGWSHSREVLQNLGDKMREEGGADILARMTAETSKFKHADWVIIDSIRHPDEINYLRDFFDAKIIGVTATPEKLFELMKFRKRPGDPTTFEEFLKVQQREQGKEGTTAMQVNKCLEMANATVWNNGNKEDLIINAEVALLEVGVRVMRGGIEHRGHAGHEHNH